jgi:hypothetical protein
MGTDLRIGTSHRSRFTHLCRPPTVCVGIESAVCHAGYAFELTIILVVVRLASAQAPLLSR